MAPRPPARGAVLIDLASPFLQAEYLPPPSREGRVASAHTLMSDGPVVVSYREEACGIIQNPALHFPFRDAESLGEAPPRAAAEPARAGMDGESGEHEVRVDFFNSVFACADSVYRFPVFPMKRVVVSRDISHHLPVGSAFKVFLRQLKHILAHKHRVDFSKSDAVPEVHFLLPVLPRETMASLRRWIESALLLAGYARDIDHVGFYCHCAASFLQALRGIPALELHEHYTAACMVSDGAQVLSRTEGGYLGLFDAAKEFLCRNERLIPGKSSKPSVPPEARLIDCVLGSFPVRSLLLDVAIQSIKPGETPKWGDYGVKSEKAPTGIFTPYADLVVLGRGNCSDASQEYDRHGYESAMAHVFTQNYANAAAAGFWLASLEMDKPLAKMELIIVSAEGRKTSPDEYSSNHGSFTVTRMFLERLSQLEKVYKDGEPRQRITPAAVKVFTYSLRDVRVALLQAIAKHLRQAAAAEDPLEKGQDDDDPLEAASACSSHYLVTPATIYPAHNKKFATTGLALDQVLVVGYQMKTQTDLVSEQLPGKMAPRKFLAPLKADAISFSLADNPEGKSSPETLVIPTKAVQNHKTIRVERAKNSDVCPSAYGVGRRQYFRALSLQPVECVTGDYIELLHGWEVILGLVDGGWIAQNKLLSDVQILDNAQVRCLEMGALIESKLYHSPVRAGGFVERGDDILEDHETERRFPTTFAPTTRCLVALRVNDKGRVVLRAWPAGFPEVYDEAELEVGAEAPKAGEGRRASGKR